MAYDSGGNSESALNGIVIPKGDINAALKTIKNLRQNNFLSADIDRASIDKNEAMKQYLSTIAWEHSNR